MRLLVVDLHRAFPELDPFTDEQCGAYVAEARKQFSSTCHAWLGLGLLASASLFLLSCPGGSLIAHTANDAGLQMSDSLAALATFATLGGWWLVAGWSLFAIRDVGLRRAIRRRLDGACCGGCGYSLLGLEVVDMIVRCPECGKTELLSDRGLTAADILAPAASA